MKNKLDRYILNVDGFILDRKAKYYKQNDGYFTLMYLETNKKEYTYNSIIIATADHASKLKPLQEMIRNNFKLMFNPLYPKL
jgi:thioredoxin reductase